MFSSTITTDEKARIIEARKLAAAAAFAAEDALCAEAPGTEASTAAPPPDLVAALADKPLFKLDESVLLSHKSNVAAIISFHGDELERT